MNRRILIITEADDVHAIAVAEALSVKGAEPTLWATSDFPTRAEETLHFAQGIRSLRIEGPDIALENPAFDVVWRRRPAYVLDRDLLHPADRSFADTECSIFRRSIIDLVRPQAFWVNSPAAAARANSKMIQHEIAAGIGLRTPETLYTNSMREVKAFMKRKAGRVVYKPFLPTGWTDGSRCFLPYTALLSDESLLDEASLRLTPGIFQELVPKEFEIRLTVMGRRSFAVKILTRDTAACLLDWRQAPGELRFVPTTIPTEVEQRCFSLLDGLGLVFGCFDFVVTPDGDYTFLEVNEMGQFLFVERLSGLPLLDAFTSFLLQATMDFEWRTEDVDVRSLLSKNRLSLMAEVA